MTPKVLVALSGGVDSAVSAYLLKKQGYDVSCVFFRSWQNETELLKKCPWQEDLNAAKSAAEHIGIPFEIINFIDIYRQKVVDYLINGYKICETPNPDIMCNRYIKFGALIDYAQSNSFDYLATGHYCRKMINKNQFSIHEGFDKTKDQSYFLCLVKKENMQKVQFPVGELTKIKVREIAKEINLPNANRKDSQGICFLGSSSISINKFLEKYIKDNPGEIKNKDGEIIGMHKGLHRYTIGQRKGIGLPSNKEYEHYVVIDKECKSNTLIVGFDHVETRGLYSRRALVNNLNFLERKPDVDESLLAKPRYRDGVQIIKWHWVDKNNAEIEFDVPQRALAIGQVVAFYRNTCLIGGGIYKYIYI